MLTRITLSNYKLEFRSCRYHFQRVLTYNPIPQYPFKHKILTRDCTSGVRKIWKQPNRRCFQPKFAKVKALLYQWGLSGNKAILWAYGVMNWGLGFLESFMSSTCSILVILIVTRQVLLSPGSSQPYLCICIFYHSGEILWSFRIKHWDWCLLESFIYSIFSI